MEYAYANREYHLEGIVGTSDIDIARKHYVLHAFRYPGNGGEVHSEEGSEEQSDHGCGDSESAYQLPKTFEHSDIDYLPVLK